MAFYRIEFKNITRGEGRSAVSASAYRSAEKIENEWDGMEHDFSRKGGVVYKEVMLPENAPEEYKDRSRLWNAVEMAEPSSRCRLARECLISLPIELDMEQMIEVVREFVYERFVKLGMCADIAIHNPVYRDDLKRPIDADGNPIDDPDEYIHNNPHAHVLLTVRPIGKDGRWEAKSQKEYICKRGDEQQGFTSEEFKKAQYEGWEKQFRYIDHEGKKVWLTQSEAKEKGLYNSDRASRSPRSTPHGRENPTTRYWNDGKRIKEWRKAWEEMLNRKFEELGIDDRVDSRSYAEQGIDKMPSIHTGPYVGNQEKRARRLEKEGKEVEHTELGERNRIISDYNRSAESYHMADRIITKKVKDVAVRLEHLRSHSASASYTGEVISKGLDTVIKATEGEGDSLRECLDTIDMALAIIDKLAKEIDGLTERLQKIPSGNRKERAGIQDQISEKQKKMDIQIEFVQNTLKQNGFADAEEVQEAIRLNGELMEELQDRKRKLDEMVRMADADKMEYQRLYQSIPESYLDMAKAEQENAREGTEKTTIKELKKEMGDKFSLPEYQAVVRQTEKDLAGEKTSRKTRKKQHNGRNR